MTLAGPRDLVERPNRASAGEYTAFIYRRYFVRIIAWDTETERFRGGMMAPELACLTWQTSEDSKPSIAHWREAEAVLKEWLEDESAILVGQNIAYDMAVIAAAFPRLVPLIFKAYRADRVTDTMVRQQIIDIANGMFRGFSDEYGEWHKLNYNLFDLVRRHTGKLLRKDGWRLRYGEFRDLPISQWVDHARVLQAQAKALLNREGPKPEAERWYDGYDAKDLLAIIEDAPEQVLKYPLDDASTTMEVYLSQEEDLDNQLALRSQFDETYAAFALHLSSVWGLRTNIEGVDALEQETIRAIAEVKANLQASGLVRKDGSRDTKKAAAHMLMVCERDGLTVRRTKGGGVCLDEEACKATEDDMLLEYSEYTTLGKTLNADVPMLARGIYYPVHCRYGIAATSRTTCSDPNLQNLRKLFGVRECFTARPGYVYIQADFPQLELYTLAQCCYTWLGHSSLGDMLKKGIDPHTAFASVLYGCTYEEGKKLKKANDKRFYEMRQVAKAFNFGKPGGLGAKKLVALAASPAYRVTITLAQAKEYGAIWHATFPEMQEYFDLINASLGSDGLATIVIPQSGFIRGGAKYCAACNTGFQGLGARCAKHAVICVAEKQYTDRTSPLFGSRTGAMVHDELVAEAREHIAHEAANELALQMVTGANRYLPDCPISIEKMEPTVMRYWSKDAFQLFDGNKRLLPWAGEKQCKTGTVIRPKEFCGCASECPAMRKAA